MGESQTARETLGENRTVGVWVYCGLTAGKMQLLFSEIVRANIWGTPADGCDCYHVKSGVKCGRDQQGS
jgi:hypothetical protein